MVTEIKLKNGDALQITLIGKRAHIFENSEFRIECETGDVTLATPLYLEKLYPKKLKEESCIQMMKKRLQRFLGKQR